MSDNNKPTPDDATDIDFDQSFLDELDKLGQENAQNPSDDGTEAFFASLNDDLQQEKQETDAPNDNAVDPLPVDGDRPFDPLPASDMDAQNPTAADAPLETPKADAAPAAAASSLSPKKSLFAKKTQKTAQPKSQKTQSQKSGVKGDGKKLNLMILAAAVALVLLILAWFLMKDNQNEVPDAGAQTAAIVASESDKTNETSVDQAPASESKISDVEALALDIPTADPSAILQADIPSDTALVKEEIDRLNDQDKRLLEQAQDIEEYLQDLSKLGDAKDEKIALLEAQIAQLEAQKQ